jgi:hypothetical protein
VSGQSIFATVATQAARNSAAAFGVDEGACVVCRAGFVEIQACNNKRAAINRDLFMIIKIMKVYPVNKLPPHDAACFPQSVHFSLMRNASIE